jgi:6-bladed beta-propeller protein
VQTDRVSRLRRGLALVAVLGACGPAAPDAPPPPEPLPWTRELPEGVATIIHAPVDNAERTQAIRVVRDLTISARGDDFDYLIGNRSPHVSVDDAGTMYVADVGNARVLVFDRNGSHVRTIGREGQGPGEFSFPMAAVVAGDRLYVSDSNASRLSRWTLAGELEWDIRVGVFPGYFVPPALGLEDGTWMIRFRLPRTSTEVVAHMSVDGDRIAEVAPNEVPGRTGYPPDNPRLMLFVGSAPPLFAPDPTGGAYITPLEEYQIFSYGLDGEMRWALQVPAERSPIDRAEKEWATGWFQANGYPNAQVEEIEWLDSQYALADIKVDGQGRIYAFPFVSRDVLHQRLPVDVYAPDGTRVFAGWLEGEIGDLYWTGAWKPGPLLSLGWQTARDDYVYGAREDPLTGVYEIVRYRLEFPG